MDLITSFAIALDPADSAAVGGNLPANSGTAATFDIAHFDAAYAAAAQAPHAATEMLQAARPEPGGFQKVMATLEALDGRAEVFGTQAQALEQGTGELSPSEMLNLTMKAQEFSFHCELTANVANRTSDGVQQLFREQS
jgi:hypothetical protein